MPLYKNIHKVLVIGSGPIVIGQAAEFDYAGTQACLALKEEGIEVILLNNNPATIMTDEHIADYIYMEPMTIDVVEEIIKKEQPDGIIGTLGGQTGLNLTMQLDEKGILEKYNVTLLGTSVEAIQKGEDREKFRDLMLEIGEPILESRIVHTSDEGIQFAKEVGYPLIIRPAYTLGGSGGGFAENQVEYETILKRGLSQSPIHQVLVERSIKGWKEIEYEVVRDENDTCIIVCNMENFDPVGVHTGDSIVVAPSQTLSDVQYQMLRNSSLKVIRSLGVIGGCNIQFALDPFSNQYYIIEVNPRVSRSSALASKATGYPIARVAAKCAIGYHLDEMKNPVTGSTFASFEPALDYVVVKVPRFPFDKFPEAEHKLGTQMKATGETMAIERSFEGALNKGLRSLEYNVNGLSHPLVKNLSIEELRSHLIEATDLRLFAIAEAFRRGFEVNSIHELTNVDTWFLKKIQRMVEFEESIKGFSIVDLPYEVLKKAKLMNMSDKHLADLLSCTEKELRNRRKRCGLIPSYKLVDTCAGEFEAETPYYYSTWRGVDEVKVSNRKKVLIIGSGPIRIGQGIEFDYCSVHAVLALKKQGYETIVINNNPETVSTDFSIADKLYFEPLTIEDILHIIEKENPEGVFIQFGGQTAINVAAELKNAGITLFGTSVEAISFLEDRKQFYQLLNKLNIPHINGEIALNRAELKVAIERLGFPVVVRPSYVIGGQSMSIIYEPDELDTYIESLTYMDERLWPLLVDQYIPGLECELDCISDGKDVYVPGIFEHIEKAGVHSGDSICIYPPINLANDIKGKLIDYTKRICAEVGIIGIANFQFVIDDEKIYCLEVNPRASRTVPILSKISGVPMIDVSIAVQFGTLLEDTGLAPEIPFTAIKLPIFSFNKLKNVNPILGPEMKSTGEILGLGENVEEALYKVLGEGRRKFNKGPLTIVCSVADREKNNLLSLIEQITDSNIQVIATKGTAHALEGKGLKTIKVVNCMDDIKKIFHDHSLACALVIPTKGKEQVTMGSFLMESTVIHGVPLFTSIDTFKAFLTIMGTNHSRIRSLAEYKYHLVNTK
ncbi:carbamoyl-phosphate synthase (glutamine-hydrolyzing) large subunit [Heyndrickxia oleronia]|uniref:carbamoyl-phosphate synthase (glutamine-hydrolyzing) large subunit n=1 Tax=Heyndrickxia oleronia TaxID=38875 RepID=UPI0007171342